jgi:hypothetical protein
MAPALFWGGDRWTEIQQAFFDDIYRDPAELHGMIQRYRFETHTISAKCRGHISFAVRYEAPHWFVNRTSDDTIRRTVL